MKDRLKHHYRLNAGIAILFLGTSLKGFIAVPISNDLITDHEGDVSSVFQSLVVGRPIGDGVLLLFFGFKSLVLLYL
jgi:hypothetical protein